MFHPPLGRHVSCNAPESPLDVSTKTQAVLQEPQQRFTVGLLGILCCFALLRCDGGDSGTLQSV